VNINEMKWPEVFETGILDRDSEYAKAKACADALSGWGCCCAGAQIPANFGKGMAAIGDFLDILPTPENCMKYSKTVIG
jgi:hypothetical protein